MEAAAVSAARAGYHVCIRDDEHICTCFE
jgi:hypothetical protein